MAGLNRVILVGRMVRDPELKKTNSGASVTSFTIAVDNLTKVGGERSTSFIQSSYEDKSGQKRSVVEVVAESVQFLEKKGAAESTDDQLDDNSFEKSSITHEGIDSSDDDLPF